MFEKEVKARFRDDKRKKELEVKGLFETMELKDKKINTLNVSLSKDGNLEDNEYVIIEQKAKQMAKHHNLENQVREIAKGTFRVKGFLCQLKLKKGQIENQLVARFPKVYDFLKPLPKVDEKEWVEFYHFEDVLKKLEEK